MLHGTFVIFTGNKDGVIIFIISKNGWNQVLFTIIFYTWSFKLDNFHNYVTIGKRRGYKVKVNGENTVPNSNVSARVWTLKHAHTCIHTHTHTHTHTNKQTNTHKHITCTLLIYTSVCSVWSRDVLFPI